MDKPMTDPVAEMKTRAQDHLVKYFHEIWDMNPPDEGIEHKEVIAFMAAFAAKEVERATAKVVCGGMAEVIEGCGKEIELLDAYRCSDCNEYFHRECLLKHCEISSYITQLRANSDLVAGWKNDVAKAVERAEKAEQSLLRATEAERLENAKAMCGACKEPENYELPKYGIEFGWTWSHQHKNSPVMMKCGAAPIWERAHGKGEINGGN